MCFACGPAVAIVGTFPLWYISIIRMARVIKACLTAGEVSSFPSPEGPVQNGGNK